MPLKGEVALECRAESEETLGKWDSEKLNDGFKRK